MKPFGFLTVLDTSCCLHKFLVTSRNKQGKVSAVSSGFFLTFPRIDGHCREFLLLDRRSVNEGERSGRICWLVARTMCKGDTETTFEEMIKVCGECDFYKLVKEEEGKGLLLSFAMLQEAYGKTRRRNLINRHESLDKPTR